MTREEIENEMRPESRALVPLGPPMLAPPEEPSVKVNVEDIRENQPAAPQRLSAPAARDTFEFGPDNFKPQAAEVHAFEAPAAGIGAAALGAGIGFVGAQAAISGAEMLAQAAKSPQGSIAPFLPGGGSGGGQDYAGQALQRAILAALNGAGNVASRFGG